MMKVSSLLMTARRPMRVLGIIWIIAIAIGCGSKSENAQDETPATGEASAIGITRPGEPYDTARSIQPDETTTSLGITRPGEYRAKDAAVETAAPMPAEVRSTPAADDDTQVQPLAQCPRCASSLPEGARFCPACGLDLSSSTESPAPDQAWPVTPTVGESGFTSEQPSTETAWPTSHPK